MMRGRYEKRKDTRHPDIVAGENSRLEAAKSYDSAALNLHGEFSCINGVG